MRYLVVSLATFALLCALHHGHATAKTPSFTVTKGKPPCRPKGVRLAVTHTFSKGKWLGFCLDGFGYGAAKAERARAKRAGVKLPLCAAFDGAERRFAAVRGPALKVRKPSPAGYPSVERKGKALRACKRRGACVTLRPRRAPGSGWSASAVDPAFRRLVAVAKVPSTGKGGTIPKLEVEIFDLRRRRAIKRFVIGGRGYDDLALQVVDSRSALLKGSAAGPAAELRLLDLRRGKVTLIKSAPAQKAMPINAYAQRPLHVGGSRWAFLDYDGSVVVLYDLARGKLLGRAKLGKHYGDPKSKTTNEEDSQSALGTVPGGLAVVLGSPTASQGDKSRHIGRPGTVVLLDGKNAKLLGTQTLPVCK
jgi:hypothetical protein